MLFNSPGFREYAPPGAIEKLDPCRGPEKRLLRQGVQDLFKSYKGGAEGASSLRDCNQRYTVA